MKFNLRNFIIYINKNKKYPRFFPEKHLFNIQCFHCYVLSECVRHFVFSNCFACCLARSLSSESQLSYGHFPSHADKDHSDWKINEAMGGVGVFKRPGKDSFGSLDLSHFPRLSRGANHQSITKLPNATYFQRKRSIGDYPTPIRKSQTKPVNHVF